MLLFGFRNTAIRRVDVYLYPEIKPFNVASTPNQKITKLTFALRSLTVYFVNKLC